MATIAEQVQQVYIGLLGRAAEKAGLDYWVDEITTGKITLDQVRANFVSSQDEYITGIGQMSRPDAITALYNNLFERDPEAEGLAYWNTGGGKDISIDGLLFALIDGAALSDSTALDNKTEVADYYTAATAAGQAYDAAKAAAVIANVGADSQSVIDGKALVDGVNGNSVNLTVDQDNLTGTAQSDTFNAYIFDNQNTAQSGDMVDGGTGTDRLYADIGNSQKFAVTLATESVEQLAVRAEAVHTDSNDNNLTAVTIDAERMEGTNWYESNNSRADVVIEDVRIERVAAYNDSTDQITRDITIAMVSTDPGDVDLGVYFDQHSLVKSGAAVSNSITLNVGNQLETALGFDSAKPLENIPYDQVSFVVNGTTVTLNIDLTGVETYAQMYTQLQAAFATEKQTNAALLDVNLTRTLLTEDFISKDGENRQADEYILTTENGTIEPATVGWNASAGLPSNNAFSASVVKGDSTTTSSLITSTVVLDDVGRGSMGGDLIIGGLSTGDTSNSKGVEQFDITVERSSQLGEIQSTNNTLREVYIKNGAVKGDLTVAGTGAVSTTNSDLPAADTGANGFDDVRVIDASAMEGKVSIQAHLSDEVVKKYMDNKDFATDSKADDVNFLYKLGTNDDMLDLSISKSNLDAAGTSTRDDFILNIEGNGGDDKITTIIGDGKGTDTDNWYKNSTLNANLSVDSGEGNDTITTTGAGNFVIDAGAGNDTVYANNDGVQGKYAEVQTVTVTATNAGDDIVVDGVTTTLSVGATTTALAAAEVVVALNLDAGFSAKAVATANGSDVVITFNDSTTDPALLVTSVTGAATVGATVETVQGNTHDVEAATWVVNATNSDLNDLEGNGAGNKYFMVDGKITVTLSGANVTGSSGVINGVAVPETLGFEKEVSIGTDSKHVATEAQINQAIKNAINEDPVLSKLLVATDGPAHSLVIKSLVDGEFAAADLEINVSAGTIPTTVSAAMQTAWEEFNNDSTVGALLQADLDGEATSVETDVNGVNLVANATDSAFATKNGATLAGQESTSVSDNKITLGSGDDVAVLGTDANSSDTLIFEGIFGNDTIFNFTEGAGNDGDKIDFSSYLNGRDGGTTGSTSPESQQDTANTISNGGVGTGAISVDEIVLINNFDGVDTGATATRESWDNLTGSKLLAAIQNTNTGSADYGNGVGALVAGINVNGTQPAGFVGSVQKNIIMVENDNNQGEYKVFEVSASTTTDEFTAAVLVGTIDFGASLSGANMDGFVA